MACNFLILACRYNQWHSFPKVGLAGGLFSIAVSNEQVVLFLCNPSTGFSHLFNSSEVGPPQRPSFRDQKALGLDKEPQFSSWSRQSIIKLKKLDPFSSWNFGPDILILCILVCAQQKTFLHGFCDQEADGGMI
jgi:hypothetical protein